MEIEMFKVSLLRTSLLGCFSLCVSSFATAHAQAPKPAPFSPVSQVVSPFGYGTVFQSLTKKAGTTGTAECLALSKVLKCLSVSGGNSCSASVPVGEMVSCGSALRRQVDESMFQPVNCNGNGMGDGNVSGLINSDEFCLQSNYMPARTVDTIYQYNDYVRVGINRRFGGTIMELYGTDKVDRILQNPGGAVQLSLYGFTSYAPGSYLHAYFASPIQSSSGSTTFDATAFSSVAACQSAHPSGSCSPGVSGPNLLSPGTDFPCGGNGGTAGSPFNPIQGQSANCQYGEASGKVDSVSQPAPGEITVVKSNPYNFDSSNAFDGLTWTQTTSVPGPFVLATYKMVDNLSVAELDYQEIPAIFLHDGSNAVVYYYNGNSAYQNASSSVSRTLRTTGAAWVFQLPNRTGPFSVGSTVNLTEDWVSSCDQTETKCVTIASFSSAAQDIIFQNEPNNAYAGIRGFFSITDHLNKTASVAVFPYRFDAVVGGKTVRQWIYSLQAVAALHK